MAAPQSVGTLLHPLLPELDHPLDISVVFGTYNRRSLLERCVTSIRRACANYKYEIVIADGGSTDGSAEWLRDQQDVVFIAGDLSGAVRAFNAAAKVAQGRYIVCLNDDATLEPDAIEKALLHFSDPFVGQVAMSFFEHGAWRILETHDKTYGNFPVTRASIVRAAERITGGMWATCYQTYGGDNELSCWVYRLGYKVVAAPECRLRHTECDDALRKKNSTDTARNRFRERWPSADYLRYRGSLPMISSQELAALAAVEAGEEPSARWSRIAALDPVPGEMPPTGAFSRERVLHWHLRTEEDPQRSMSEAFTAVGTSGHIRLDWTYQKEEDRGPVFMDAANSLRPTLIFMQLHGACALPIEAIDNVRSSKDRDPSLVVCAWSGDVGPSKGPWANMHDAWQYKIAQHVDLMLYSGTGQVQIHRQRGMANAAYLQIGYDTDRYFVGPEHGYGTRHSAVFIGQDYTDRFDSVPDNDVELRRRLVHSMRRSLPGFFAYGSGFGPGAHPNASADIYRTSSIAISASVTSRLGRYTSDRTLRSMACGCPTFIKRFDDMEGMGMVSGMNCIAWDTTDELVDLANQWLDPSRRNDLRRIGLAGAALVSGTHTWAYRMNELAVLVNSVRGLR